MTTDKAIDKVQMSRAPDELEEALIRAVAPYTMTSYLRLLTLQRMIDHVCSHGIPGSVVECGVWKGGSMILAAYRLLLNREDHREIYLYDTFDGMSEPTELDVRIETGKLAAEHLRTSVKNETDHIWAYAPLEAVKANVRATRYPEQKLHFVRGKVEDTIPGTIPDAIALLRLDTDWYESTRHELMNLYDRVSPGGIVVFDDYGCWDGARRAVDEFLASMDDPPVLRTLSDSKEDEARWLQKPFDGPAVFVS